MICWRKSNFIRRNFIIFLLLFSIKVYLAKNLKWLIRESLFSKISRIFDLAKVSPNKVIVIENIFRYIVTGNSLLSKAVTRKIIVTFPLTKLLYKLSQAQRKQIYFQPFQLFFVSVYCFQIRCLDQRDNCSCT